MAENDDISIRVGLKGMDQASRSLKDLIGDVRRSEGASSAAGAPRRRDGEEAGPSTRQPGESGPGAGGSASANFMAELMTRSFSALNRSVTQSFDPLATKQERQARLIQTGLNLVPFVGETASNIFGMLAENQLAPGRNAAQRIGGILDPAIRASGLTDPAAIRERFGADIRALRDHFAPQERASRAGQQAIADEMGDDLDLSKIKDDALAQAEKVMRELGIPIEDFKNAIENFKRNTESFGDAVRQIVEHWQGVINGNRSMFEGVRR
jgi:hypothetical protein